MYEAEILSKRRHSNGVTESSTRFLNAVIFLAFLMMVATPRVRGTRRTEVIWGCRKSRRGNIPVIQTTFYAGRLDRVGSMKISADAPRRCPHAPGGSAE